MASVSSIITVKEKTDLEISVSDYEDYYEAIRLNDNQTVSNILEHHGELANAHFVYKTNVEKIMRGNAIRFSSLEKPIFRRPLSISVATGSEDVFYALLSHGANALGKDVDGCNLAHVFVIITEKKLVREEKMKMFLNR